MMGRHPVYLEKQPLDDFPWGKVCQLRPGTCNKQVGSHATTRPPRPQPSHIIL